MLSLVNKEIIKFIVNRNNGEEFSMYIDYDTPKDIIKGIENMLEHKPKKRDTIKVINTMLAVKPSVALEENNKDYLSNRIKNQESLTGIVGKL